MKNKKTIALLLLLTMLMVGLTGCFGGGQPTPTPTPTPTVNQPTPTPTETVKTTVKIAVLKGPTGMGMAWLMEQNDAGNTGNEYEFTVESAPDAVLSQLITGALDMAAIPTNAAALLHQKTNGNMQVLAVNTLGVLYILEKGEAITDVAALEGKTLVSAGKGTTAEYVLNYVLTQNGLVPGEDVIVDYVSEHAEAVTLAQTGEYSAVVLPEPFVTSLQNKDDSFRIAVDLTEQWEATGAGLLTMGAIVARKDFAAEHPEAVAHFMEEYAQSVAYTNEHVEEAAALIEQYDILAAAVAKKAIPNANIVFLTGQEMKGGLEQFLTVLFQANPASIGGVLPTDDFYYMIG